MVEPSAWGCCTQHALRAALAGRPLDRGQIMAEVGIMWGAGFEVSRWSGYLLFGRRWNAQLQLGRL